MTTDQRARQAFDTLTREEVSDAIADMIAMGFSETTCAAATGLSKEAIRKLMGERRAAS